MENFLNFQRAINTLDGLVSEPPSDPGKENHL